MLYFTLRGYYNRYAKIKHPFSVADGQAYHQTRKLDFFILFQSSIFYKHSQIFRSENILGFFCNSNLYQHDQHVYKNYNFFELIVIFLFLLFLEKGKK